MNDTATLRLVLADDADLLREALAEALGSRGFAISGQAGDAVELLRLVEKLEPDVVIVDVRMPPTFSTEGIEAALAIRARWPGTGVLVLSEFIETYHALELARRGSAGVGYLLKDRVRDLGQLAEAIRRVAVGGTVIDPDVVARLLGRPRTRSPLDELTPREREILALMAEGRSNQAVADRLTLELKTIEGHVRSIFSKLGLEVTAEDHRRVLAVLAYLRAD